jgi:hypothetical protein
VTIHSHQPRCNWTQPRERFDQFGLSIAFYARDPEDFAGSNVEVTT